MRPNPSTDPPAAATAGGPGTSAPNTLFHRVGGAPAVRAVVSVFYRRVLADPRLAQYFAGVDLVRLESHQRWFLAAALGGPDAFAGRGLVRAHAGRGITDAAFDAVCEHLATSLADLGVGAVEQAEITATVRSVRLLVVGADGAHDPDAHEPPPASPPA